MKEIKTYGSEVNNFFLGCWRGSSMFRRFSAAGGLSGIIRRALFQNGSFLRKCISRLEFIASIRAKGYHLTNNCRHRWEDRAFRRCFQILRRLSARCSKEFVVAVAAFTFDWEHERIPEEELRNREEDIDLCHRLRKKAEVTQSHSCDELKENWPEEKCWTPFIVEENLTVWKKVNYKGSNDSLCCYKVYGKFHDVCPKDFLAVYLDVEHRKAWDQYCPNLRIIESEPSTNSDVIYWESKWPKMFSNRDYVFKRRFVVDDEKKLMIVASQATSHPDVPPFKDKVRVTDYWSFLTVRADGKFDEPGMEFSLTYFDNPGSNIPSSFLMWGTINAMPSYLKKLQSEALKLGNYKMVVPFAIKNLVDDYEPNDKLSPEESPKMEDSAGDDPPPSHDPENIECREKISPAIGDWTTRITDSVDLLGELDNVDQIPVPFVWISGFSTRGRITIEAPTLITGQVADPRKECKKILYDDVESGKEEEDVDPYSYLVSFVSRSTSSNGRSNKTGTEHSLTLLPVAYQPALVLSEIFLKLKDSMKK